MRLKLKGQGVMEYAFLAAVVAAGLLAMQIYLKRGLQGRLRLLSNSLSDTQYSPGRAVSNLTTVITMNAADDTSGVLNSASTNETRIRSDTETISR